MTGWLLLAGLVLVCFTVLVAHAQRLDARKHQHAHDHAVCMSMVAAYVGNQFAASVLEATAEHYGSMDGQADQRRIANTMYSPGGPSVPEMYLRERAEAIRQGWPS